MSRVALLARRLVGPRVSRRIAAPAIGREVAIYLFVLASDFSEKWIPLFGPML